MIRPTYYVLLLGSNIEKEVNLPLALKHLESSFPVEGYSSTYLSRAVGVQNAPDFHNQAVLIRCDSNATNLRNKLRQIEADQKRLRTSDPNSARTIDIDIVLILNAQKKVMELRDAELLQFHHIALPVYELLGDLTVEQTSLGAVVERLGEPPEGFRHEGEHKP